MIMGKENPGVGEYETGHHNTVGNKEFQGGAANNFVLFTRQNYQSRVPDIKQAPRIAPLNLETTPENIGPGSYIDKEKKDFNSMFKPKMDNQNLKFGLDKRFKYDKEVGNLPGPGAYNEQNKWN